MGGYSIESKYPSPSPRVCDAPPPALKTPPAGGFGDSLTGLTVTQEEMR